MEKPNRYTATPEEVADWLRTQFSEDVVLAHQQWIGDYVVGDAAGDLEVEAQSAYGTSDYKDFDQWPDAVKFLMEGGPYPSGLLCPHHEGADCPGWPVCRAGVGS